MSKHYVSLRQWGIGKTGPSPEEILKKLALERPDLAAALAKVDWAAVKRHVARLALEKAAKALGGTYTDTPRVRPNKGDVVGAVLKDGVTTGLVMNGDRPDLFQEGEAHSYDFENAKKAIEKAYREEATKAMLEIIGGTNVTEETGKDGSVVIRAKIKEGK